MLSMYRNQVSPPFLFSLEFVYSFDDMYVKGKQLLKKLSSSVTKCSIDSPPFVFQFRSPLPPFVTRALIFQQKTISLSISINSYYIEGPVCYMTLTEREYPKQLAFVFLEEIREGFERFLQEEHGDRLSL